MKTDGSLARCPLKGTLGDALHAVLCGCGHNIRLILAHLRIFATAILRVVFRALTEATAPTSATFPQIGLRA